METHGELSAGFFRTAECWAHDNHSMEFDNVGVDQPRVPVPVFLIRISCSARQVKQGTLHFNNGFNRCYRTVVNLIIFKIFINDFTQSTLLRVQFFSPLQCFMCFLVAVHFFLKNFPWPNQIETCGPPSPHNSMSSFTVSNMESSAQCQTRLIDDRVHIDSTCQYHQTLLKSSTPYYSSL